ncbi:MAG: indole-3-glycerol phosphate synthase TrpC [Thermodesulfovibrionales bacterium]
MGILKEIVDKKKMRLDNAKSGTSLSELKSKMEDASEPRAFEEAIKRSGNGPIKVISEIKKASPSQGLIRADFDPVDIAKIYQEKGASAISVLTEEDYFKGSLEYIRQIKNVTTIPVLRKDFIIDEYQIYEARVNGADAVLLIAAILSRGQADDYLHMAQEAGISVLFEVHDSKELDKGLSIGVPIIGINNRNLDTLEIAIDTTIDMLKDIPSEKIIVTESGVSNRKDVELFEKTRVDAVLVGTALMKENDIAGKYDQLFMSQQ